MVQLLIDDDDCDDDDDDFDDDDENYIWNNLLPFTPEITHPKGWVS